MPQDHRGNEVGTNHVPQPINITTPRGTNWRFTPVGKNHWTTHHNEHGKEVLLANPTLDHEVRAMSTPNSDGTTDPTRYWPIPGVETVPPSYQGDDADAETYWLSQEPKNQPRG